MDDLTKKPPYSRMKPNEIIQLCENLRDEAGSWRERTDAEVKAALNPIYKERNYLVALLASLFPSSLERHPEEEEWEDDWRWIVFIDLPTGQATWHIHDSELGLFEHVPRNMFRKWDGHTTGQKYQRVISLAEQCLGIDAEREKWHDAVDFCAGKDTKYYVFDRIYKTNFTGDYPENETNYICPNCGFYNEEPDLTYKGPKCNACNTLFPYPPSEPEEFDEGP